MCLVALSRGFNVPMQDGGNKEDRVGAPRGALEQLGLCTVHQVLRLHLRAVHLSL